MKLTNTIIREMQCTGKEQEHSDDLVTGLKIRIPKTSNTKTFYIAYRNPHGKKKKYKLGKFGDIGLPAAREAARNVLAQVALGQDPQAEKMQARVDTKQNRSAKLRTFLDEQYYPYGEQHQKAHRTLKLMIERSFPHLMNKRMDKITNWDIEKWRQNELKRGIKPATINRAIGGLQAVLNAAVRWGIISKNPIATVKKQKLDKRGVVRWLSDDEEKRLYQYLDTKTGYYPVLLKLLLHTGARPKEAYNLTWKNVNFDTGYITLDASFTKTGQTRHVPLNRTIFTILKKWKKEQTITNNDLLFPNEENTGAITGVRRKWLNTLKATKIEKFRVYDCRHTFASKLAMQGVAIYEIAELMGHANIEMTKVYAHLSPEYLKSAVEKIA